MTKIEGIAVCLIFKLLLNCSMSEYYFLGNWTTLGVPNYLATSEEIDPQLINRIRLSLPEKNPVPTYNPSYLFNTSSRNLLIKSSDPDFGGADVWVTFIDEGAGYRNVSGYFIYDLHDGYEVPTKFNGTSWVPMEYSDRNLVDANGKSVLKKTIVFPNASLKGSGGNLSPGNRVKLLYNPSNPAEKFPNNIGIGFFLVPNGWNGSTVVNTMERVYTYNKFNNPAIENGSIQTVLLSDTQNTDETLGTFILGFEDIMRPQGDQDFNDLIIKIAYSPSNIFDTSDSLNLATGKSITTNELVADKTGLYISLPPSNVNTILSSPAQNVKIVHKIKCNTNHYNELLKKVFDTLILENDGIVEYGDDYDEENNHISIKITYIVPKNNIKNYNYLIRSIENKYIESTIYPGTRNIANFQDMYVFGTQIVEQDIEIKNNETDNVFYSLPNLSVTKSNMTGPYSMGDPHIQTIDGISYMIHNTTNYYELYDNDEINLSTKLNYYPTNQNHRIYSKLTFMEYLFVKTNNFFIAIDLFNPNVHYSCEAFDQLTLLKELPNDISIIKESEYTTEINTRITNFKKKQNKITPIFVYYLVKTPLLGELIIEVIYIIQLKDYINHVGLISNKLSLTQAKGAFISQYNIKSW